MPPAPSPPIRGAPTAATTTKLFVWDLPVGATSDDLRVVFAPFGDVISVRVPFQKHFAFVELKTAAAVAAALRQHATSKLRLVSGAIINVKANDDPPPRVAPALPTPPLPTTTTRNVRTRLAYHEAILPKAVLPPPDMLLWQGWSVDIVVEAARRGATF